MKFTASCPSTSVIFQMILGVLMGEHVLARDSDPVPTPFEWVSGGGSQGSDKTRAIAVDPTGNVYIAGEISGAAEFGKHSVESHGKMDVLVAKLSSGGEFLWVKSFGGSETDRAYGVTADAQGNVYVSGHFQSTDMKLNGVSQINNGDYDFFVLKLDPAGDLLWGRTGGGLGYDYAHAIALDSKGDVVVTGAVVGEAQLGSSTLNAASKERPIFVAKYTNNGELKWARCTTGVNGGANGVGIDAMDQIYLGGSFNGQGSFDSVVLDGAKGSCGVILKMTSEGAGLKAAIFPGTSPTVHEIAVDGTGRVWAAGMFKQNIRFGGQALTSSGTSNSDGFCAALDKDMNVSWVRGLHGEGVDYCLGVTTDGRGRAFFTGEFSGAAALDSKPLQSAGGTDVFVAAFDSNGELEWVQGCGSEKGDNAYTIAWHKSQFLAVGGACTAVAHFGSQTMNSARGAEAYAAKMILRR